MRGYIDGCFDIMHSGARARAVTGLFDRLTPVLSPHQVTTTPFVRPRCRVCLPNLAVGRLISCGICGGQALCDILVVGIHTDDEIRKHKGPPVMNNDERCVLVSTRSRTDADSLRLARSLATVRSCKWADEVCWGTPYDPSLELLVRESTHFLCTSRSFSSECFPSVALRMR